MLARSFSFVVVALFVCGLTYDVSGQGKDKDKDKDAKKDADKKKFEVPKDAIAGTIKSVDSKAATFTITLENKKERTFKVDDKTEFWGPKGGDRGTGVKGLSDDTMAKGYEVKVTPAKDSTVAKDVFLPTRKAEKKDK